MRRGGDAHCSGHGPAQGHGGCWGRLRCKHGCGELPGSPEFAAESRALDTRSLGYRFVKRTFDIAFSACVCVVALIPGTVLCAFIAADTKGAPIYAHERAGRFGRPIRVLKFRSMVADATTWRSTSAPSRSRSGTASGRSQTIPASPS